jgi:predicted O-methyltransferase YrrM
LRRHPIQFIDVDADNLRPPSYIDRAFRHSFFSWAGFRSIIAEHTVAEHNALQKYSRDCFQVVEIGVAEGASAIALRDGMNPRGNLYLIDPYHLSRARHLNFIKRTAKRVLSNTKNPRAFWIEAFSHAAAGKWNTPIDFLLIDGDHSEEAVERDWDDWHPHVVDNGIIAFHDSRLFPGGWTSPTWGPVRFVDRLFRQTPEPEWQIVDEVDSLVFVSKRINSI